MRYHITTYQNCLVSVIDNEAPAQQWVVTTPGVQGEWRPDPAGGMAPRDIAPALAHWQMVALLDLAQAQPAYQRRAADGPNFGDDFSLDVLPG